MSSILIKNVFLDGSENNIYIEDNIITEIGKKIEADVVIDGKNRIAIPGLINTHTHLAMTLFRGYADDMRLSEWLQNKIWHLEKKLTPKDIYYGTLLACIECIKTGTTCVNDMYFFMEDVANAINYIGIRGVISEGFIDLNDPERLELQLKRTNSVIKYIENLKCLRIKPALGPHAVYTVSSRGFEALKEIAKSKNLQFHIHLAETEKEFFHGSQVQYLEKLGILEYDVIAAHAIHLSETDLSILAKHNVKLSYNAVSNMKLASGIFKYTNVKKHNIIVTLGTDGTASNNNLDMFETMKFSALLQKIACLDSTVACAKEIYDCATKAGAIALNINCGAIETGKLADIILLDKTLPEFTPMHNYISNIVYSCNGSCVNTVICDGKILMHNRKIPKEKEIITKANRIAKNLVQSC